MVIEAKETTLLVDPMLSKKGTMPSYTEKRFKPQKNPIVELPENCFDILKNVTHCLITHLHSDHLDKAAEEFLVTHKIPVICSVKDEQALKERGLNISHTIAYWKKTPLLGGQIEGIPAVHGYGEIARRMGNVMGYFIQFPHRPSIYLSSDTIYTNDVRHVLSTYQPDICVVAAGSAQLDEGEPILMTVKDIIAFAEDSPKHVIANHMEAVNHCTTSRQLLKAALHENELAEKVWIPLNGAIKTYY